jgi:hypothetical protein
LVRVPIRGGAEVPLTDQTGDVASRLEPVGDGLLGDRHAALGTGRIEFVAEPVVFENWSVTRGLIVNASPQQVTTATAMGWVGHQSTTASRGKPAFIEHVRGFVDEPGEWFLDRKRSLLSQAFRWWACRC